MDPQLIKNPRRLIAFTGRAGSGKSLASQTLITLGWERVKFSSPLKNMLRAFYKTIGLGDVEIERRIEGDLKEEPDLALNGASPRRAMQTLGQEWGRDCISSTLWLAAWNQEVINAMVGGRNVVVDDCRYANEARAIRKLGGEVIAVFRPSVEITSSTHASEKFEFEADHTLINEMGPEDLVAAVHELVVR